MLEMNYFLKRVAVTSVLICFAPLVTGEQLPEASAESGRELYWHGTTPTGTPLQATIANDIKVDGTQFSCVNCHRPSGFGSSEGGKYVPPVTGPILFSPRELNRNRIYTKLFQESQPTGFATDVRKPRMRPAYTGQTLAGALRNGVDPAGRKLDPQMPRYDLGDPDVANLVAYLKTLSAVLSRGVDSEVIHFATVVSDDADPRERDAVIKTISAFVGWMNRATDGYRKRPGFSPNHMSELASAFRNWKLHVWELHGPSETWSEQIRRQYDIQPVFAVVSGLVHGAWSPVGDFCDANQLPCVFPNTELPKTKDAEYGYSIYFSRGLTLEGEVMARYLGNQYPRMGRLALVHSTDPYGATPAGAFSRVISSRLPDARVQEFEFSNETELNAIIRNLASTADKFDALILWPGDSVNG
ncbi:MAG: c-type cytochrome, partial [Methylococcales bacterium]|nr:c-type cytochrome [Methylococcales bacterium]